jgi:cation:H+ antiporter
MTVTLILLAGVVLLVGGAEMLVRGASRLATAAGISPLVIGLTVVAYGTSAPELAVSLEATLRGQADVAVGNVVGSNIFNVLFILGVSAAVAPLIVSSQLVRLDVPIMIAASFALLGVGMDGHIGRVEGAALALAITAYTVHLIWQGQRDKPAKAESADNANGPAPSRWRYVLTQLALVIGGVALLVVGSRALVDAAITIATRIGVSELVIGLTIVAAGTSLPELATSVLASARGERDIAVGNVVGSNVFNILAILGLCGIVGEGVIVPPAALRFDIPVMIGVAVLCLPIALTGNRISRREGLLFVGYYAAYVTYLILNASGHDALPVFSNVMLLFVLPVSIAGLLASALLRRRRR